MQVFKQNDSWCNSVKKFDDARSAVEDAVTPGAYSYDGKLDRVDSMVDNTVALIGRLMDVLHAKNLLTDKDVVTVLGYGYTTQPDGSPERED